MHFRIGFVLLALVISIIIAGNHYRIIQQETTAESVLSAVVSPTPTPSPTPIPTFTTTPKPKPNPTIIVSNSSMASANEIFTILNQYRAAHGVGQLTKNSTLCTIAQGRADQQQSIGHLDHAGFQEQATGQKEFLSVAEILQYVPQAESATFLIESGWAMSGDHNGKMLDPKWTHGCAGVSGYFATFVFGGSPT